MPGITNSQPGIPEERRFVWRNLDAFLAGEISKDDHARIEAFLAECPYTKEYVETEQQFSAAVHRCVGESPEQCPPGLRDRILDALDRCQIDDAETAPLAPVKHLRFPWLGVAMMTAASIMLVVALVQISHRGDAPPASTLDLQSGLAPMVSHLSLDCPRGGKCKYKEADETYRELFADAPVLPRDFAGTTMKVATFECIEVEGKPVMCAVYDSPEGERFGFMVFCGECVKGVVPPAMQAAEVMVDGRIVLMWREGKYIRALVGYDEAVLRRHMSELRGNV